MNKHLISLGLVIGVSTLMVSTGALSAVVDPVTGLIQGTANVFDSAATGVVGFTRTGYLGNEYIAPGASMVRPGIIDNNEYVIQNNGSQTLITNANTGKTYVVKSVKYGTMDVVNGNGTQRYQYDTFYVKPL